MMHDEDELRARKPRKDEKPLDILARMEQLAARTAEIDSSHEMPDHSLNFHFLNTLSPDYEHEERHFGCIETSADSGSRQWYVIGTMPYRRQMGSTPAAIAPC